MNGKDKSWKKKKWKKLLKKWRKFNLVFWLCCSYHFWIFFFWNNYFQFNYTFCRNLILVFSYKQHCCILLSYNRLMKVSEWHNNSKSCKEHRDNYYNCCYTITKTDSFIEVFLRRTKKNRLRIQRATIEVHLPRVQFSKHFMKQKKNSKKIFFCANYFKLFLFVVVDTKTET